jgi:hypothetical protein
VLEKQGYRLSESSEAVLREYFAIPEDRLKTSVTYEKARGEDLGSRGWDLGAVRSGLGTRGWG